MKEIVQIAVMRTGMTKIPMEEYIVMGLTGDITVQATGMVVFIIKDSVKKDT